MSANKISPIKTEASINQRLLKMTGDKKRYGGGATRTIRKISKNINPWGKSKDSAAT